MANQASAASSSSAPSSTDSTRYPPYDVFINHRGPDVKEGFASRLYRRLRDNGLRVFLDKPELIAGEEITCQIEAAIQGASVNIAIFSPTYAESRWCLDELTLMVESKEREKSKVTILPIFFNVKPAEVKYGSYAEALRGHQEKTKEDPQTGEKKPRYESSIIQKWRTSLLCAAEISGFELGGDEEELLSKVVQSVLKNATKSLLHVAEYPTGLEEKVQEFEREVLQLHEEPAKAKVVGIVGYGGAGKTTLAKSFFNQKRSNYNQSSFLFDVRETSVRKSLKDVQSQLLEDLKRENEDVIKRNVKIRSTDEGIEKLKRYLSNCHALVIIDDVDDESQLEALLPVKDILNAKSLILITSRDKYVLKKSGVSLIYNLKGLNTLHSKMLFCSYAFHQSHSQPGFEELVDRFVTACNGLPLSLKVIGALLFEENEEYWEEQFNRLSQTLPEKIQERLRISYDALGKEDKIIFLDIACFFLGESRDKAIRIWGLVGVRNLENKCLLEVNNQNEIRMHDHIRDCARSIAGEGSVPRRLWQQTPKMIEDWLEKSSSVETEVRGITSIRRITPRVYCSFSDLYRGLTYDVYRGLTYDVYRGLTYDVSSLDLEYCESSKIEGQFNDFDLRCMKNLRFLATEDAILESILRRVQPPQIIWLQWYGCSSSSLPDWIPMKNLRVLEVAGKHLTSLWREHCEVPQELRELNILAPISEFPKCIGQMKRLEWIRIGSQNYSCGVTTLPEEFCNLSSLKYLWLTNFSKLMLLPDSFGKLTNLQHIHLDNARSLKMLPASLGKLTRLKHLYISHATAMLSLPDSFGELINLQHFHLLLAHSLEMLPNSVCNLARLEHLRLTYASTMLSLPDSFGKLTNLQHIDLSYAGSLKMLPDSFGKLTNLQHIDLSYAGSLKMLPDSASNLSRLKYLSLRSCSKVIMSNRTLGNITTLEYLDLRRCSNVKELPPQVAHQRCLKNLYLCENLKELPSDIGNLYSLEVLIIRGGYQHRLPEVQPSSPNLKRLPDSLAMLTQLRQLYLYRCGIKYLPEYLLNIKNLEILVVSNCPLRELPLSLKGGRGLKTLTLEGTQISEVAFPEGVFPNLKFLRIQDCQEIRQIGELCGLAKLEKFIFSNCVKIEELPSLETLRCLKDIHVEGCTELKSIPGIGWLTKLQSLRVKKCHALVSLPGVEHCTFLKYLEATDCPKLQWGRGVRQQLRKQLGKDLEIDVIRYKRRKKEQGRKGLRYCNSRNE